VIRSPARFFAPLALVACAVAVLVIVNSNTGSDGSSTTRTTTTSSSTSTTTQTTPKRKRFYVVKPGDVLSQIAIKTGVPLETIQRLNPTVDAQSLHAGQKLKLTP
jgi:LysM repeat protein